MSGPGLHVRDLQPELMDDPNLDAAEHRKALTGLARLNRLSGAASLLWPVVVQAARSTKKARRGRPLRIIDLATGSADVPLQLALRAARAGLAMEILGVDRSAVAVEQAERAFAKHGKALEGVRAQFLAGDVLDAGLALPIGWDLVMCSLFCHHLSDEQVVRLLQVMKGVAGGMVVVSDLERSRLNLMMVGVGSRLVTRSRVVHADAVQSVRAAFTCDEFAALCIRAGLAGATIRKCIPARFIMMWKPS